MIRVKHATKSYGPRHNRFTAIDDVTFEVPEGSTVAIVGKSGSGKSTLMHLISGLDRPDDGEVIIEGKNIFKLRGKELDQFRNRHIGFIFQSFFVEANESLYQNVSLPLEIRQTIYNKRREKILWALERVDMQDKVNVRAGKLSGGEKQRLAIARAIVNEPKIIFADEPTGNLDSATGAKVVNLLFELNKQIGSTLFVVTHDHELAARCQILIQLKDGKLVSIKDTSSAKNSKQAVTTGKEGE
ncbi:MAG TPA: ABC transporter ATP-binding protein [Candidatus Saccharimonadales bacterium]|nr:ABC transporter ATP-binding protein [Candidatus Saccharimonadales bacterium]